MEQVFSYIIGLGAAVMMPIIFTILGVCIGIKFSKALKSGLLVGVGFVGLSVVTALLTSSLGPALSKVVEIYGLQLKVFDMGWVSSHNLNHTVDICPRIALLENGKIIRDIDNKGNSAEKELEDYFNVTE